jgi:glyoxylase-like metal-dependent hydrolase (beta-lactamase superfamily II)
LEDADSSFNILVMHFGDEVVLVDGGEGAPKGGDVVAGLRAAGVAPDDVSLVVITHADGDHVLGLVRDDGAPTFGRARYVISRPEWAWWRERAGDATEHQAVIAMVERQGLQVVAMDEQIGPGLRAVPLAGHTPGHTGVLLESEGERLLHLADLVHSPMQFAHPEWSPTFDHDTSLSVPARERALAHAADSDTLTLFYHLTFPGLGYVRRAARGFRWEPLAMES